MNRFILSFNQVNSCPVPKRLNLNFHLLPTAYRLSIFVSERGQDPENGFLFNPACCIFPSILNLESGQVRATLPNFHLPAAAEILTTGSYSRLPRCLSERIIPPAPITAKERTRTLLRLNQVSKSYHLVVISNPLQWFR